jgi:hypothetical protein
VLEFIAPRPVGADDAAGGWYNIPTSGAHTASIGNNLIREHDFTQHDFNAAELGRYAKKRLAGCSSEPTVRSPAFGQTRNLRPPAAELSLDIGVQMNSVVNTIMIIGPMVLLTGVFSLAVFYLIYHYAPTPKKQVSLGRYVLVALAIGALAYVIGTVAGISAACISDSAGNLCGLVGVFGAGPLLSGVAIFMYARSWAKSARRAS